MIILVSLLSFALVPAFFLVCSCLSLLSFVLTLILIPAQFTFGFSRLPTPAQMRASLADQLGVEDLRRKFRKYAAGRVAPELPDFYKVWVFIRVLCVK